jgi:mRNA interferase MazF
MKQYIPERGDIVWLNFTPQTGHEQQGKRPALTLTKREYNQKTNLGLFCPITSKIKGYPFEVLIQKSKINGVIIADQIRSLDWKARECKFIQKANEEIVNNVLRIIYLLIE